MGAPSSCSLLQLLFREPSSCCEHRPTPCPALCPVGGKPTVQAALLVPGTGAAGLRAANHSWALSRWLWFFSSSAACRPAALTLVYLALAYSLLTAYCTKAAEVSRQHRPTLAGTT